ncbi:hypothetical protein DL93DRAFT_2168744 [Clavulina sp. PMI_390]|nr:hypothetical protein DL93DRAFT_2168744 [Clavulina sp. PMI_390]
MSDPEKLPPPDYTPYSSIDNVAPSQGASSSSVVVAKDGEAHIYYFYYRLFQNYAPIPSHQAFGVAGGDGKYRNRVGRLQHDDIPPPRTIGTLKRTIARLEGFDSTATEQLHFPSESLNQLPEDTRLLDLLSSGSAAGTDQDAPIDVIIQEGAVRSAEPSPTPQSRSAMWTITADGSAEPRVDGTNPCRLASAEPLPPWKRGHVKGKDKVVWAHLKATDAAMVPISVHDYAFLYVNPAIRQIGPRACYRIIVVAESLVGYINVEDVVFEGV